MDVLIIAATHNEIQDTIGFFEEKRNELGKLKIEILIAGVGLVSTAYLLSRHIHNRRPDLVIQAGIAGCFRENKNNTIVLVNKDIVADMGVEENNLFKNIFDLNLANKNEYPYMDGWLVNPYQKLLSFAGFEQAIAVSVNEITTNKNRIEWYQQKYEPFVESMEGAAFHYVCLQEKIPFLQLRAISNFIGERDKTKWIIKNSIGLLNEQLILLITKLSVFDETYFRI